MPGLRSTELLSERLFKRVIGDENVGVGGVGTEENEECDE
jgi:hypothetical protein